MAETRHPWWKFEPTVNLGHILTVIALLGGGISVYVGVFQTLTGLVLRVNGLEAVASGLEPIKDQTVQSKVAIDQLQDAVKAIKISNDRMLEQLTGIRIDVGILSKTVTERTDKP